MIQDGCKTADVSLKMQIEKNVFFTGDENLLSQVVLTLLQNALEAVEETKPKDATITLSLHKEANNVVLTVTDNGKMIDYEFYEKIYEPFFTTKKKGSGSGLYLAKTIVEQNYGGSIRLINDKNTKSFIVKLCENR